MPYLKVTPEFPRNRYLCADPCGNVVQYRTLVVVSLALAVALAAISFLAADWMWFCINILSATLLFLPRWKRLGYYYDRRVVTLTMVAPALMVVLYIVAMFLPIRDVYVLDVSVYTYITAMIQTIQSYTAGLMFALILNRSGVVHMTTSWVAIFAMVFSMAVSALDLLFTFGDMYSKGYPVFNKDFTEGEAILTNRIMMSSPVAATFVSLILTIWIYIKDGGKDAMEYIVEGDCAKPQAIDDTRESAEAYEPKRFWADLTNLLSVIVAVALMIGALTSDKGNVSVTTVFCCIVCLVSPILGYLRLVRIPPALTLLIFLAAGLHAYGLLAEIYGFTGSYDVLTHTLSSTTIGICVFYTLMCFQVYSGGILGFTGNGLALFTGIITLAFSTYWEVIEFFSDLITGAHAQYSPYDTLTDLVCDMCGMFIASFAVGIALKKLTVPQLVASFRLDDRLKSRLAKKD